MAGPVQRMVVGLNEGSNMENKDIMTRSTIYEYALAKESLDELLANDSPELRRQIIRTAKCGIHMEIWLTVFNGHPEILKELS